MGIFLPYYWNLRYNTFLERRAVESREGAFFLAVLNVERKQNNYDL